MSVADLHFSHEEHNDVSSPTSGREKELESVGGFLQQGQTYQPDLVIFQEP